MKGVQVYYSIKMLRQTGASLREIAERLGISKTTVDKYLKIPNEEVEEKLIRVKRPSVLDKHKQELIKRLSNNPKIRLSKLHRIFLQENEDLQIGQRAFFNYAKRIKDSLNLPVRRYYRVVEYEPGIQMQVDPGETYIELINGERRKLYFCVFKYCYSRMTFVHFQFRPYKTSDFIQAHKECFEYFGYIPKTMIYDQTKLVVIKEIYREVTYNNKFFQFMNSLSIEPHACEGYDPESKGLVERAVREVKEDFLYGEVFSNLSEVKLRSKDWFEDVNNRYHSTINETPLNKFNKEKQVLRCYKANVEEIRKVDKTGLISWKGNKYSVPYRYQQKSIIVREDGEILEILDLVSKKKVASHRVSRIKTKAIISQHHYIDYSKALEDIKKEIIIAFPNNINILTLIDSLIVNNRKNPREQLLALLKMFNNSKHLNWSIIISKALLLEDAKATKIELIVNQENKEYKLHKINKQQNIERNQNTKSQIQRDLSVYDKVGKND